MITRLQSSTDDTNDINDIINEDINSNDDSIEVDDVTSAKNHFHDVENYTRPIDIIEFYHIINGSTYKFNDIKTGRKSIIIQREYFDDNILEFISSREEIKIN